MGRKLNLMEVTVNKPDVIDGQYQDLAATIAVQAQAIADETVVGPRYAAVRRLMANVELLKAWTRDDRSGNSEGAQTT